jgi:quinol monooxygenase YgiN
LRRNGSQAREQPRRRDSEEDAPVQYIRLSLMKAKAGRDGDVARLMDQLVDYYKDQEGFLHGYTLKAADETGDVGRVTVWVSEEAADHVAQSNHVLSLRSDLMPMLVGDSDIERSFWANEIGSK